MATLTPQPPNVAATLPADGDTLYEVVDGQVVEKAATGVYGAELASLLVGYLLPFVKSHKLGKVVGEVLFQLDRVQNLQRRPNVAFVSDTRWPYNRNAPQTAAWVVYPNARTVDFYESPSQVKILQVGDTLDGAPLLPGFHLPLAMLFEEQAE